MQNLTMLLGQQILYFDIESCACARTIIYLICIIINYNYKLIII